AGYVRAPCSAWGLDHPPPSRDPPQSLAQVPAATYERHGERPLVDVVLLICRGQHLGLVDVIHAQGLKDLSLDGVTDATLGHHRDGDGSHYRLDEGRVRHAGDAAFVADVG